MKDTLTVEELSKRIGIGRNTAYEAVKRGEVPSIKIGRRILVPIKALNNWLENGGVK